MTDPTHVVLFALLGLVVGSFLNVCIHRLPRGESIVHPPSHCPVCGHTLRWFDNVPVLGWVQLGGRCRGCRKPISIMYPAVEVATPLLFLLQYWEVGLQPLLVPRLVFTCAMIVLFLIDLQHRILPNVITVPGIVIGLAFSVVLEPGWIQASIGVLVGGGSLLAISEAYYRIRGEEGLGMGDVKMLGMIGAFLGWQVMLVTLLFASLLGSIVGIGMMAFGRGGAKYALPLGSFLAAAAVASTVIGQPFVAWYASFY